MVSKLYKNLEKPDYSVMAIKNVTANLKKLVFTITKINNISLIKNPNIFDNSLLDLFKVANIDQYYLNHLMDSNDKTLLNFAIDCCYGKENKWTIYKQEISNLASEKMKGRAVPNSTNIGGGSAFKIDNIARKIHRMNDGVGWFRSLPFHKCKTLKQKIKLVMDSDATTEVKIELIKAIPD